jgi:hypothetical protein
VIPSYPADAKTGKRIHLADGEVITDGEPLLITGSLAGEHGLFQSVTRTTAGTTAITTPLSGGCVQVTGFVLSVVKGAGQFTTLQFSDGSNTEDFAIVDMDSAQVVSASFANTRVRGWEDAHVDIITSGAADATVVLYYFKLPTGQAYASWDAER